MLRSLYDNHGIAVITTYCDGNGCNYSPILAMWFSVVKSDEKVTLTTFVLCILTFVIITTTLNVIYHYNSNSKLQYNNYINYNYDHNHDLKL